MTPPSDPKDKRILAVDDEPSMLEMLTVFLEKEGFQVETALDGAEALKAVKARPPDLIILDLLLPGPEGHEVLRRLQQGDAARIPVIVVTGRYKDSRTSTEIRKEPNVVEFIQKPIKATELVGIVHRALGTQAPT